MPCVFMAQPCAQKNRASRLLRRGCCFGVVQFKVKRLMAMRTGQDFIAFIAMDIADVLDDGLGLFFADAEFFLMGTQFVADPFGQTFAQQLAGGLMAIFGFAPTQFGVKGRRQNTGRDGNNPDPGQRDDAGKEFDEKLIKTLNEKSASSSI